MHICLVGVTDSDLFCNLIPVEATFSWTYTLFSTHIHAFHAQHSILSPTPSYTDQTNTNLCLQVSYNNNENILIARLRWRKENIVTCRNGHTSGRFLVYDTLHAAMYVEILDRLAILNFTACTFCNINGLYVILGVVVCIILYTKSIINLGSRIYLFYMHSWESIIYTMSASFKWVYVSIA